MNELEYGKIKHAFVREMHGYSRKELKEKLSCDDETLNKIIRILRYKKYIKIKKREDSILDMSNVADELIDVSDALANVNGYAYTFDFVGIIVLGGFIIKCYPKYILENHNPISQFKQVLKVLEKHESGQYIIKMFSERNDDKNSNLLETILFLLQDFYENGAYSQNGVIREHNGDGEIIWDRTVDSTIVIIDDDCPYYVDLITKQRIREEQNYFRMLHKYVLTECSRLLTEAGLFEYFDELSPVELSEVEREDFGSDDYILYRIERELGQQFNTHKRIILQALHSYIAQDKSLNDSEGITAFGTNSFNLVWQDVCADVLEDKLHKKLRDLVPIIGPLQGEFATRGEETLKEIIAKPNWKGFSKDGQAGRTQEAKTLDPDIIGLYNVASECCMAILDAKYYVVQFEPELKGQPGLGDITKQYLYNLAYRKFLLAHNITSNNITNCFLMPTEGLAVYKRGYANMEILGFLDFIDVKNIDVILLPAENMYSLYLNGKHFGEDLFKLLSFGNREFYGEIIAM